MAAKRFTQPGMKRTEVKNTSLLRIQIIKKMALTVTPSDITDIDMLLTELVFFI